MPAPIRRELTLYPGKEDNLKNHPKREPFFAFCAHLADETNSL
jgi:hypothetical protein